MSTAISIKLWLQHNDIDLYAVTVVVQSRYRFLGAIFQNKDISLISKEKIDPYVSYVTHSMFDNYFFTNVFF